jgi:hypothetical protein
MKRHENKNYKFRCLLMWLTKVKYGGRVVVNEVKVEDNCEVLVFPHP